MKKTIEWFVKLFIYATFFVPLLVVPSSFIFPFVVPKILMFRSLVILILAGYILLYFINKKEYKIKFTPVNVVLSFFIVSFSLSTFLGTDAYHSFWDNHERMLGLFTILHYFIYFIVCRSVLKNWKDWRTALRIFLIAGSIVMFIGALQIKNTTLLMNQSRERVASTLGNSIYVSSYGLFLFFTSLLLLVREKTNWWRAIEIVGAMLAFVGIFYGGSRGVMVGLAFGVMFMLFGYGLLSKNKEGKTKKSFWIAIVTLVALAFLLFTNLDNSFVRKIPAISRFSSINWTTVVNSPRYIAWEIAVEGWKERPILGWGPNNFFYAFNKYYNPRSLSFGYGETWFDNAHNIVLNTLAVQGLFGVLIYLSIFIVAIYVLWKSKENREKNKHLVIIGSAFLLAHFIQNITVFENPTSYLYFMFWLAMIDRLGVPKLDKIEENKEIVNVDNKNDDVPVSPTSFVVLGLVAFLLIFIFNIQPAKANKNTLKTLQTLNSNFIRGYYLANDKSSFSSPHIDDIRTDISRTIMQRLTYFANNPSKNITKEEMKKAFDLSYSLMEENIKLHPMDIRNHLILGQLGQVGSALFKDPKLLTEADKYLETALYYSKNRQQIKYSLANIKLQLGKRADATRLLEEALESNLGIPESYWRLAYVYNISGQNEKAREVLSLAKENNIVFGSIGNTVIAEIVATTTPKPSSRQ